MPVVVRGKLSVSREEARRIWAEVLKLRNFSDDEVVVQVVDEAEIRDLNKRYRRKNKATNVLTFSYEASHDVALCLAVAERESRAHDVALRDYVAWLLAHAFLHVTGMDHERSPAEAEEMKMLERDILRRHGFIYPVN